MINKKQINLFLLLIVLTIPFISSAESFVFKQDTNTTLEIPIFENDISKCVGCTCTTSIDFPDGTNIIRNLATSIQDNYAIIPINLTMTSQIGIYKVDIQCTNGADNGAATFEYEVNGIGSSLSTSQAILYIVLLVGIAIILFFTIWGAVIFPWRNPRDDDGGLITINNLKYLKVVFWIFAYLEFLFAIFILKNLSGGYLAIEGTYSFFNIIFTFLLIAMLPAFPLLIFFTIVIWLNDKKMLKAIARGLPT